MRQLALLVLPFLIIGCSHTQHATYSRRSGDLVSFALAQAIQYGARPKETNALPIFLAEWRFKTDPRGVVIRMDGDRFKQIESFLIRAFGEPDPTKGSAPAVFRNDRPEKWFGYYSHRQIGVTIQYFGNERECGLIIVGPPKS